MCTFFFIKGDTVYKIQYSPTGFPVETIAANEIKMSRCVFMTVTVTTV